jgi:basic membrane protein A
MLGGGLCIDNSSSVINANTIQGNKAMNGGGVEIYYATAVLTDNIISSNIATGGGMFAIALGGSSGGGVHLHKSQAVLSGNVVDSNSSSAGGGLHLYESNVTLNENVVTCNAAVSNGGGLWLTRSSVTLGSNTISGNTAGYHGGGLDAVRSSATIVNNVITDNRSEMGGGVYLEGSILRLLHATAARNSGGGVYVVQTTDMPVASSSLAMTNAMLISHTVGITVAPGNTATLNGVLLYGNTTNLGGAGVITVSNAITGDPIFAADGYHLLAGSAAIDRGVNTEVATDIDGRHRPQGAAPDLGADEFPGIGLVISKSGPAWALPGAPITYWLTIQNRGDVDITETLAVTDRVPIGAHPVGYPPQSVITWTFPPTSPIVWPPCDPSYCYQAWAVRFVVTATETITNSDYGARTGGLVVRGEPIVVTRILNHPLYLPLVLRAYPPIRACLVTDVEGIDDHAFNAAAWQGVLDAINEYGIEGKYLESQQPTDYDKHLARFVQEGCDLIIAVGWRLGDATKQSATQNSNKRFTIVDMVYEPPIPNLAGSTFNVDEAAFLAGYLAAGMSKTGKVGTWGGIAIPPVTIYMDGFLAGVNYYNEKNNTHVQVLGWDGWEGLFINNFESVEDGIKASETLADKGADIHLPVTGPAGVGAAIVAQERHLAVIGIDSDWFFTQPGYQDAELTSVIKNANVTVKQAIESVIRRDFSGDVITGTLANGGVSLAPFHTFEDRIPPALKEDLVGIAADIIAGKIKISDYLPR